MRLEDWRLDGGFKIISHYRSTGAGPFKSLVLGEYLMSLVRAINTSSCSHWLSSWSRETARDCQRLPLTSPVWQYDDIPWEIKAIAISLVTQYDSGDAGSIGSVTVVTWYDIGDTVSVTVVTWYDNGDTGSVTVVTWYDINDIV